MLGLAPGDHDERSDHGLVGRAQRVQRRALASRQPPRDAGLGEGSDVVGIQVTSGDFWTRTI